MFVALTKLILRDQLTFIALINTTYFYSLKKEIQMVIYRGLLLTSDHLVFGANAQRNLWLRKYFLPAETSSVLFNGVDTNYFSPSPVLLEKAEALSNKLELSNFDLILVSVAQLREEKRHIDIIDACSILQEMGLNGAFLFVGKGEPSMVESLKNRAVQLEVDENIFLIGQVNDPRPYLLSADLFLLASRTETFSNSALEAMAMGVPALLSDVGGASEMIEEGYNGLLHNAMDAQDMAKKIYLFWGKFMGRKDFSRNARQSVIERFSFERMVQTYTRLAKGQFFDA
jgi:glycosyltransferase involved in cell wall biosynthesis